MDAVAALRTGKRIDHHGRRAHQAFLHGSGGLDGSQFRHQWRIQPAAKLGEPFREHQVLLRAIHLDLRNPPGLHDRPVGSHPATDLFVGTGHLVFQQLQRQQPPRRDGWTAPCGGFGDALGERPVHGGDEGRPGKRVGPWANGMRVGHEVGHLEAWSASGQPMLEVA